MHKAYILILGSLLLFGCDSNEIAMEPPTGPANYYRDIKPLLSAHCLSCHTEGGIGIYSFETAEDVASMAVPIVTSVENRTMPPWGQDPNCRPSVGSLRLEQPVIDIFTQWKDHNYPLGDPADDKGDVEPEENGSEKSASHADILLEASQVYVPDVGFSDDYRCLILPHDFESDTYVYQSYVFPERLDLVHHVIVYIASGDYRTYFEDLDAESEEPGFECFGGTGVDAAQMLVGWAPGAFAVEGDQDYARLIPSDSVLVMQMHYNLAGKTVDDVLGGDSTQVALWTLPEGEKPSYITTLMPVFDFGIEIPPGESFWPELSSRRLPVRSTILGTAPHMHLLGQSIKVDLIREDGTEECLTKVDDWDFDWQRTYLFPDEQIIPVSINDTIRMECTYDNSAQNQPVVDGEQQDPQQVTWGDGSFDEMCLNYLVLATPFESQGETGICTGYQGCRDTCDDEDSLCDVSCAGSLGIPCLECQVDGLFGPCAQSTCGLPMLTFGGCYDTCSGDGLFDFFNCIHGPCKEEFDAFQGCLAPYLEDGTCESDYADCTGMFIP